MKKLILLFTFFSFPVFAQINFEKGYFINNNNVKTDCLIRNVGWQKNPIEIEYKNNENEDPKKITIFEIKEFNIGDSYRYIRFKTNLDRSSSDINELSSQKNPIWKEETLLLKLLVKGTINLYQYEENNLVRYFISNGNYETAEQLVCKEFYTEFKQIAVNNYFKQQLSNTLKSDKLTNKDFEKLLYKKKELTNFILKYNETTNNEFTNYEKKQNQGKINFKIIVGINATFNNLNNSVSNFNYTLKTEPVLRFGFESEYILPFNQEKWSLIIDPNFQSNNASEKTKNNQLVETKYNSIEIPFGFRHYMFLRNKSKIFIGLGMNLSITSKSYIKYSGQILDVSNSTNYFTGIGFCKKRYSAELRYNLNRNLLATFLSWETKYSSLGLLVGYKVF